MNESMRLRNWDDDEAERKLINLAEAYRKLEHENELLRIALNNASNTERYYVYHPLEENHLETLASDMPIHINACWLLELVKEARNASIITT
jgi:hypothetical protein